MITTIWYDDDEDDQVKLNSSWAVSGGGSGWWYDDADSKWNHVWYILMTSFVQDELD